MRGLRDSGPARAGGGKRVIVALVLTLVIAGVYFPVGRFPFLHYDDQGYVSENEHVKQGLSRDGALWALTTTRIGNWVPLTWFSHMLAVELFGMNAGAHHLVNVALHAGAATLLFLVLSGATGALWPSAFAAALFAVHPLHVESVAWVSERKDVLVGLLWMLTLFCYGRYARRPSWPRYLAVGGAFGLSLLAKPTAVTLPVVLLLADFWPLGRMGRADGLAALRRLVLEKTPLFVVAGIYGIVTLVWQTRLGIVKSGDALPFATRAANAAVSAAAYLTDALWPFALSPYHSYPSQISSWRIAAAALCLIGISAIAVRVRRTRPFLLAGWLWYLVVLLPVIGLVQVGWQSRADRYAYLPLVGMYVAAVWAGRRAAGNRDGRLVLPAVAAIVVFSLAIAARAQVWLWKDTETLFTRAVERDGNNWFANLQLGNALLAQGKITEALGRFEAAVRSRPPAEMVYAQLAELYIRTGRHADAVPVLRQLVALNPRSGENRFLLGKQLVVIGAWAEASGELEQAVSLHSGLAEAHYLLGLIREQQRRAPEAERHYRRAIFLEPGRPEGWYRLGMLLVRERRLLEARPLIDEALRLNPQDPMIRRDLELARQRAGG